MYACENSDLVMVNILLDSNASVAFTNQVSKVIRYILTNQRGIRQQDQLLIAKGQSQAVRVVASYGIFSLPTGWFEFSPCGMHQG